MAPDLVVSLLCLFALAAVAVAVLIEVSRGRLAADSAVSLLTGAVATLAVVLLQARRREPPSTPSPPPSPPSPGATS